MPAFLVALFAKKTWAGIWAWVKAHATLMFLLAFSVVLFASVALIYNQGHKAGQDHVAAEVAQQHEATVAVARHDEQLAQTTSDAVGQKVAQKTDANHADTLEQIQEIKDELAKAKAAAQLAAAKSNQPVVADVVVPDSVRDKSNALIAGANGSADYTGPAR